MANDSQAHQQPPRPNPDLRNLGRLVGTWKVSGGAQGRVTFEWMEGGFFLIQHVDLEQYGQKIKGHDDRLLYERYFDGYDESSIHTSFSMAKSFASALVGIAIDEGHINSVNEPITNYIPELLEKDERFESITIRHLLTMSSGIKYEEGGALLWSGRRHQDLLRNRSEKAGARELADRGGAGRVLRVQQLQPPADRDDTREGNGDECLPLPTAEAVEAHGHGGGRLLEPGQHLKRLREDGEWGKRAGTRLREVRHALC